MFLNRLTAKIQHVCVCLCVKVCVSPWGILNSAETPLSLSLHSGSCPEPFSDSPAAEAGIQTDTDTAAGDRWGQRQRQRHRQRQTNRWRERDKSQSDWVEDLGSFINNFCNHGKKIKKIKSKTCSEKNPIKLDIVWYSFILILHEHSFKKKY